MTFYKNKIYCDRCNKNISRLESKPIYLRKQRTYKKIFTLCNDCYIEMLDYLGLFEKWYQNIKISK